jgi:5-methylphenazine-1-carboxylate 1-monooxygenase
MSALKVIIAGGGIGGLTAALSMHEAGIDVQVFESASRMKPLGVGINCLPHAVRELSELGVADALASIGVATRELIYTNKHGQQIWREDRGRHAGYQWPQYSIHRGKLQMLLWDTALERLGPQRLHADHSLARFEQDDHGVTAWFESRATPPSSGSAGEARGAQAGETARGSDGESRGRYQADLLIGADGIHSTVRKAFYPNEGPPKWNGGILWRGVTRARPYLSGASMIMAGYEWEKFVCYPISEVGGDGLQDINWIAELKYRDRPALKREDWNRAGVIGDFLPAFERWNFGWLDCPGLITGAPACLEFPLVDRDPLPAWQHARVTLIGDAAHPMYPIGSNGASQAILDARVLAWRLATESDPLLALQRYEEERRPATANIVLANRRNGPERVMQMAEERAPAGFGHVHEVISADELAASAREYKLIAGFDKDALTQRQSYTVRR